jgi:HD-GYP domain-containing protein (c-di-GMP phosphodiesterase class II)
MSTTKQDGNEPDVAAHKNPFVRRGRIAWTLAAVLLLVGLVPLALMAWRQTRFNRVALATVQQEYQQLVAETIAREVDIHVDGLQAELLRVSQTLGGAIRRTGGPTAELRGNLAGVVDERMPYLRYDYFLNNNVRSIDAGEIGDDLKPVFDEGLKDAVAVLTEAVQTRPDITILSAPILAGSPPRARVLVSAPVVSGGRFRGVLSSLVDLEHVWDLVVSRRWPGHTIFGVDPSGRVFSSNSSARNRPGHDVSESALVQRFLTSSRVGRETLPFIEIVDGEKQQFLGSYEVTRQGWGVFIQAPESKVYRSIEEMVEITWNTAALVLVLCVAVSWFFVRTLSHPINRLAAASSRFAAGDLSTRVAVRTRNEIGELAHSFNLMADEIEEQIRKLKRAARENHELFMDTIRAMAQAIDAKDPYTRGHSMRVNRYSVILAKELGVKGAQLREIHVSSLMHDVGKIGINDAILQKPGKLTDEEFEIMKTHTVLGANILAPIRQMKRIIPGLRWHHERMNGQGYPDGLFGDQIPLMARIIAIADTFDAVTTHRPYQKTMTFDEALQVLERLKGDALDEKIVDAFMSAYSRGLIRSENPDEVLVDDGDLEPVETVSAT